MAHVLPTTTKGYRLAALKLQDVHLPSKTPIHRLNYPVAFAESANLDQLNRPISDQLKLRVKVQPKMFQQSHCLLRAQLLSCWCPHLVIQLRIESNQSLSISGTFFIMHRKHLTVCSISGANLSIFSQIHSKWNEFNWKSSGMQGSNWNEMTTNKSKAQLFYIHDSSDASSYKSSGCLP